MSGLPHLHLVTDDAILASPDFLERAGEAMAAGGERVAFHLRGPRTSGRALWEAGRALAERARATGVALFVNDRVDLALALATLPDLPDAPAPPRVHLGERSLPPAEARRILGPSATIGRSVHSEEEAARVRAEGADYLHAGPLFETASHPGRDGLGPAGFARIARAVAGTPVLAIGGVDAGGVAAARAAGAYGVAVIRAWWEAADVAAAVRELLAACEVAIAAPRGRAARDG